MDIMNHLYEWLIGSLILNSILLFCLFSPNIVMFIHKEWFNWKNKTK